MKMNASLPSYTLGAIYVTSVIVNKQTLGSVRDVGLFKSLLCSEESAAWIASDKRGDKIHFDSIPGQACIQNLVLCNRSIRDHLSGLPNLRGGVLAERASSKRRIQTIAYP